MKGRRTRRPTGGEILARWYSGKIGAELGGLQGAASAACSPTAIRSIAYYYRKCCSTDLLTDHLYCTPALTAEELYISMLATATVFFELLKLPATVTPWPANLAAMT